MCIRYLQPLYGVPGQQEERLPPELAALLGQGGPVEVDGAAKRQVLAKQELLPRTSSVAKTIVVNIVFCSLIYQRSFYLLSATSARRKTETAAWSGVTVCGAGPGNPASSSSPAK